MAPGYPRLVGRRGGEKGASSLSHSALERDSSLFPRLSASGGIICAYVTWPARPVARRQSCGVVFAPIIPPPLRRTGAVPAGELRAQRKGPGSIDRLAAYAAAAVAVQTRV